MAENVMKKLDKLEKEVVRRLKFDLQLSKDYYFEKHQQPAAINGAINAYKNVLREIEKLRK
jgi:hypothetical protein